MCVQLMWWYIDVVHAVYVVCMIILTMHVSCIKNHNVPKLGRKMILFLLIPCAKASRTNVSAMLASSCSSSRTASGVLRSMLIQTPHDIGSNFLFELKEHMRTDSGGGGEIEVGKVILSRQDKASVATDNESNKQGSTSRGILFDW